MKTYSCRHFRVLTVAVVAVAVLSNAIVVESYQTVSHRLPNHRSASLHLQVQKGVSKFGENGTRRRRRSSNGIITLARHSSSLPQSDGTGISDNSDGADESPPFVQSIVLKQVYPAMVRHMKEYGNPNIPLGSNDGKKCKTLRRLAFQKKLTDEEIALLEGMNFRFNSLEEVYDEADFDECLERLIEYEDEFKTNYQIPKKYKPDPELGAWVTMIRRLGRDNIAEDRREKLDAVNFAWVSTRKCGSSFMSNFRPIKEKLDKCCSACQDQDASRDIDDDCVKKVLEDADAKRWILAQADAAENGNLSDARIDYMNQLPGIDWRSMDKKM